MPIPTARLLLSCPLSGVQQELCAPADADTVAAALLDLPPTCPPRYGLTPDAARTLAAQALTPGLPAPLGLTLTLRRLG